MNRIHVGILALLCTTQASAQSFDRQVWEAGRQISSAAAKLRQGLAAAPVIAVAPDGNLPGTLCGGPGRACSKQQQAIWEAFLKAPPLKSDAVPGVFSGACYHRAFHLDAQRPEYAVAFFDQRGGEYFYGVSFSFNLTSNPYRDWTVEEARRQLARTYKFPMRLLFKDSHAEANFNPGTMVTYWFRRDAGNGDLLLLSHYGDGKGEAAFCRLPRNEGISEAQ